jgi:hypothetical protein
MARRRPKSTERDDSAVAFPTEGDAVGLKTLGRNANGPAPEGEQSQELQGSSRGNSLEEIARRAYERYQQRGGTHGHDQEDWFEAEREVRGFRSRNE